MDALRIVGGNAICGTIAVHGAKNAALPIVFATLLTEEPMTLRNMPQLADIRTTAALLTGFGVTVSREEDSMMCNAHQITDTTADYALVKTMRASILALGPLLARCGHACISLPGGCAIGMRPVDMHLAAFRRMGAQICIEDGYIVAKAPDGLHGADVSFDTVSVTGTENIMMAAMLSRGRTIIRRAAQEPEVIDLANCLRAMGANIVGAGTETITIDGVSALHGCEYVVMGDRIEAGTLLTAAAMTGGSIMVTGIAPGFLAATLAVLRQAGCRMTTEKETITLDAPKQLQSVSVRTAPYPGFATDMQAQCMAMNAITVGTATVCETIFENRFMHVAELSRLGADIAVSGNTATVRGVAQLRGAHVMATDLRASASLLLAGLAADGETILHRIYHLDRGYDAIDVGLRTLGADVCRIRDTIV